MQPSEAGVEDKCITEHDESPTNCTFYGIFYSLTICDPAPLNEALWGEYQNLVLYFIAINKNFYTFWCKNYYSTIFLSKVTTCWTLICSTVFKTTLQRFGLSKIVIYVQPNRPINKQMHHNTPFLPYFHSKGCLSWFCMIWWIFRKNISKMKNFDLGSYFCSLLKINFTAKSLI